jgi:hypothetical protein
MSSRNSYNQHPKKINCFFLDQYFKTLIWKCTNDYAKGIEMYNFGKYQKRVPFLFVVGINVLSLVQDYTKGNQVRLVLHISENKIAYY